MLIYSAIVAMWQKKKIKQQQNQRFKLILKVFSNTWRRVTGGHARTEQKKKKREDANWNLLFKKRHNKKVAPINLNLSYFKRRALKIQKSSAWQMAYLEQCHVSRTPQQGKVKKKRIIATGIYFCEQGFLALHHQYSSKKYRLSSPHQSRKSTDQLRLLLPATSTRSEVLACLHLCRKYLPLEPEWRSQEE